MLENSIFILPVGIICLLFIIFFIVKPKVLLYTIPLVIPFRFTLIDLGGVDLRFSDLIFIIWILVWFILAMMRKIKLNSVLTQKKIIYFLLYCIITILIGMLNTVNISGIVELVRLFIIIITGITISTAFNNEESIIKFLTFWAVGSLISSIYSIIYFYLNGFEIHQLLGIANDSVKQFYDMKFSSSPLFEDPNNFASYLILSIFLTWGLLKSKIKVLSKIKIKIIIFFQVVSLILTLSRSAYIGVLVAIIINICLNKKMKNLKIIKGVIFLIMSFVVVLGVVNIFSSDYSAMSRLGLWSAAINMSISNPIFGVGLANFPIYFLEYVNTNLLMVNPHPHNLFLRISAETGVIGLILFLNIYFKPIVNNLRNEIPKRLIIQRYLILGLIAFFVQAIGVEYLASRHFWIITSLVLLLDKKNFGYDNSIEIGDRI